MMQHTLPSTQTPGARGAVTRTLEPPQWLILAQEAAVLDSP
uniref:Uncharacterized protein n=1 Tax=Anguilla anguilla TaxID=7936 RepID=A0A0E9VX20_ANGAN